MKHAPCIPDCAALFTAPEVLKGDRVHGSPVDYWSLGCMLYVMLFGCYPFLDQADMRNPSSQFNRTIQKYVFTLRRLQAALACHACWTASQVFASF